MKNENNNKLKLSNPMEIKKLLRAYGIDYFYFDIDYINKDIFVYTTGNEERVIKFTNVYPHVKFLKRYTPYTNN